MRRFGEVLIVLGGVAGVLVAAAMFLHPGFVGVPWIVNVGLAKLGLLGAAGLMASGAMSVRLANRREQRSLNGKRNPE